MRDMLPRNERTVRVTHVVWNFDGGGLESVVADLARRYHGTDVQTSVISLSGHVGRQRAALGDALTSCIGYRPTPHVSMAAPIGLARRIRASGADVVHLHSGTWYKGALAARLAGVSRVVYTEHGREHDDPRLHRLLDHAASHLTDVVVAVSPRLNGYLRMRVGVAERRLRTIENGVDVNAFSPRVCADDAALRAALGIPADAFVIGSVGRLVSVKAYDRLVRAIAGVHAAMRDRSAAARMHLVIAGDGPERDALQGLAAELDVADVVHFPGWVQRPAALYRLFDVFALTSVSEGASLSLLEAMACGCTPVVTDVGGNRNMLGALLRDQVVAPGDSAALERALTSTLQSRTRRLVLGGIARQRVLARYNLDRVAEAYRAIYRGDAGAAHAPREQALA